MKLPTIVVKDPRKTAKQFITDNGGRIETVYAKKGMQWKTVILSETIFRGLQYLTDDGVLKRTHCREYRNVVWEIVR